MERFTRDYLMSQARSIPRKCCFCFGMLFYHGGQAATEVLIDRNERTSERLNQRLYQLCNPKLKPPSTSQANTDFDTISCHWLPHDKLVSTSASQVGNNFDIIN